MANIGYIEAHFLRKYKELVVKYNKLCSTNEQLKIESKQLQNNTKINQTFFEDRKDR